MVTPPLEVIRLDVPSADQLRALAKAALPLGVHAEPGSRTFLRDVYFDTVDGSLLARGAICRLRHGTDDRRVLTLVIRDTTHANAEREDVPRRFDATVAEADATRVLDGASEPARRLRGLVNPSHLAPVLELETERHTRLARDPSSARPQLELRYDLVTVRAAGLTRTLQELKVRRLADGPPRLEDLAMALQEEHGLRVLVAGKLERARLLVKAMQSDALAREVMSSRAVAVVAVHKGRIACRIEDGSVVLPVAEGSGEGAARHLLRSHLGSEVGDLQLLSTAPASDGRPLLEVWLANRVRRERQAEASGNGPRLTWLRLDQLIARAGTPALRDPETLAALLVAARSDVLVRKRKPPQRRRRSDPTAPPDADAGLTAETPMPALVVDAAPRATAAELLNSEVSLLEFNARVLAMAEDADVPLLERIRFLSVVSANLDEFFMVRVGGLKVARAEVTDETAADGLTPAEQLDTIALLVRPLVARQYECLAGCLRALAAHGVRVLRADELSPGQRAEVRQFFQEQVFPLLTPQAITLSSGFPFPIVPGLSLSLAATVREAGGGPEHLVHVRVPRELPRFVQLEGGRDLVPIEEVLRAELGALHPGRQTGAAFPFRVTRSAAMEVDEARAGDLLQAIEEESKRRRLNPAVRLEVERSMPDDLRERLLRELQLEAGAEQAPLGDADVYDVDGPLDLARFSEVAALPMPELLYPPFEGASPIPPARPLWELLRERDVLVHYPYDRFDSTAERFLRDAASDPEVAAIKVTLYRVGERSPIVDALRGAAAAGKDVTAFVELKARFDEERNVTWARALEDAGAHVVYGLAGVKIHAKLALVVRREAGAIRRYVYVGSGNLNAATARRYTDVGLLSADEALGADLNDLFNQLTGSSRPQAADFRKLLVAPFGLVPGLLRRIDREIEHARAGRGGRIRLKVNGLSDAEVIRALYRASSEGVDVEMVVRALCALRPGAGGVSERIRVVSVLGRFLEHARIYYFANGGDPEYFIGSADLRPRNLRRRVEVLAAVTDPQCRARLDEILDVELADPTAWTLGADGRYERGDARGPDGRRVPGAQERFMAMAEDAAAVGAS